MISVLDFYLVKNSERSILKDGSVDDLDESGFLFGMSIDEFHAVKSAVKKRELGGLEISYFSDSLIELEIAEFILEVLRSLSEHELSETERGGKEKLMRAVSAAIESGSRLVAICD